MWTNVPNVRILNRVRDNEILEANGTFSKCLRLELFKITEECLLFVYVHVWCKKIFNLICKLKGFVV